MEQRIIDLERRVTTLEQALKAQAPAAPGTPSAKSPIYKAKNEEEGIAIAKKSLAGVWTSTGYETSGRGSAWMKWEFLPNGTMQFSTAYSADSKVPKWTTEKRKWVVGTGKLKATGELVYLIQLEPAPHGSIIIQRDGTLEWSTGEFECVFKRGDQFKER